MMNDTRAPLTLEYLERLLSERKHDWIVLFFGPSGISFSTHDGAEEAARYAIHINGVSGDRYKALGLCIGNVANLQTLAGYIPLIGDEFGNPLL